MSGCEDDGDANGGAIAPDDGCSAILPFFFFFGPRNWPNTVASVAVCRVNLSDINAAWFPTHDFPDFSDFSDRFPARKAWRRAFPSGTTSRLNLNLNMNLMSLATSGKYNAENTEFGFSSGNSVVHRQLVVCVCVLLAKCDCDGNEMHGVDKGQ